MLPALGPWLKKFVPPVSDLSLGQRLVVALGATAGILVTGVLSHWFAGGTASSSWPWLVAPMGASAVLVFGASTSPLAQPWSVVGGNTVSALIGVACVWWIPSTEVAAAVAVGSAIAVMASLRCLHPPGGASALLVALTGMKDPVFALFPVLTNSVVLVVMGLIFNNLTAHPYPYKRPITSRERATDPPPAPR